MITVICFHGPNDENGYLSSLQRYQKFKYMYQGISTEQLIEKITGTNIPICHECGSQNFHYKGLTYQLE